MVARVPNVATGTNIVAFSRYSKNKENNKKREHLCLADLVYKLMSHRSNFDSLHDGFFFHDILCGARCKLHTY